MNIRDRVKEAFGKSLVQVASTTNALVVTGGTNSGCMKLVGDSFKDHSLSIGLAKNIVLLGIANWGSITNNKKLVKDEVI